MIVGVAKVKIITDSQFTIKCITLWIHNWKRNNWKTASGGPVKNKEDLKKLDSICQTFIDVKWVSFIRYVTQIYDSDFHIQ